MHPEGAGAVAWREHVRRSLRRREAAAPGLRALLERHERLRERSEAQEARLAAREGGGGGGGERAGEGQDAPRLRIQLQLQADVAELRREREELRQEVSFLTEVLRQREAENQEQRARMGRLAQEAASLAHQYEEAQSKAWELAREAEGLRTELEGARGLLEEARREHLDLEAHWLEEKAQEARRLNQANEQQEKYRRKVTRLQEKLERMREAAGLGPRWGAEMALKERDFSTSHKEAQMVTGGGQEEPSLTSPLSPQEEEEAPSPRETSMGSPLSQPSRRTPPP